MVFAYGSFQPQAARILSEILTLSHEGCRHHPAHFAQLVRHCAICRILGFFFMLPMIWLVEPCE